MTALIVAGEAIFSLPFAITRYFRPTFLQVFDFTNLELGQAQSVYGVVAILSYFAGGPVADLYSARKLMTASLLSTAVGGLYMASIPGVGAMSTLWGIWGATTIVLFWAAMIRATRDWGGSDSQGRAFGILDGGRGLFSAILALAAVQLFKATMPEQGMEVTPAIRAEALAQIIHTYTAATFLAAVFVWFGVPDVAPNSSDKSENNAILKTIVQVMKRPTIWLHALIVMAAYVGYKATDFIGQYAEEAFKMSEVDAAQLSSISAWVRPVAAILAGFAADRWLSSKVISVSFVVMIAIYGYVAFSTPEPNLTWILVLEISLACTAVYGLRGVYFALFEEAALPLYITGTATGFVSVVGYTPDIFVTPIAGWLLDNYPGIAGHQYFNMFLMGFATLGLISSLIFGFLARDSVNAEPIKTK
ncbi:MAG TPA: MFS transporter [Myxococcales bacterium]|nr:MFS transporter [Myxococcales bacterium]